MKGAFNVFAANDALIMAGRLLDVHIRGAQARSTRVLRLFNAAIFRLLW